MRSIGGFQRATRAPQHSYFPPRAFGIDSVEMSFAEDKSAPEESVPTVLKREKKPSRIKTMLPVAGMGLLVLAAYLSPLRAQLERVQEISAYLRSLGFLAPLVATLGVALLVVAGMPRLLCCGIAGMSFGFWQGLLWVQLGALLGNYAVFLVVRTTGREWGRRYLSRHGGDQLAPREGLAAVIMARQLPLPGLLTNLAFGLSPIRHRHFLLGTALGQLPLAIPCTLVGAGILHASFSGNAGTIGLSVGVLTLFWAGGRYARRSLQRNGR